MCAVSLVDRHRQWFKAQRGLETRETPRDISFCTHAIKQPEPFIVRNAEEDPLFANNQDRVANREALAEVFNEAFGSRDAAEWVEKLHRVGIPGGVINSVADVFNHPQAEARQLRIELDHPTAGKIGSPGYPYKFSETPAESRRHPPR